MIGVATIPAEFDAVREFFELFKTPWELYRDGQTYDVLLCSGECVHHGPATLVIHYAGRKTPFDGEQHVQAIPEQPDAQTLSYKGYTLPIYGDAVQFENEDGVLLTDTHSQECVAYLNRADETARIGYDLFQEVQTLLTSGQPASKAAMPALELHIMILRDLIVECGIPLVEVPPVPEGYSFIACLTHDVDNPSIRQHRWDHTTFGFLYRAILGSVLNMVGGNISPKTFLRNWSAALKLPLVQIGLAEDFWRRFAEDYRELESGLPSTFFVIPFSNRPGKTFQGQAPGFRAARYGAADIGDIIQGLIASGCEVGLHGIDAWFDSSDGLQELEEVHRSTGTRQPGVRMHWLYFDQHSPVALEQAGAAYDSTIGYNNAVGYRAGTTQAYKPFTATELLELPLHAMDTALFYPAYLALSQSQAASVMQKLIDNAVQFGGCLTINWHDRSLAPERNWDVSYRFLLQELKASRAWFATAGQVVSWFKRRRSVRFETDAAGPGAVCATASIPEDANTPGLRLRVHNAQRPAATAVQDSNGYVDLGFQGAAAVGVPGRRHIRTREFPGARLKPNQPLSYMQQQPEQPPFIIDPEDRILVTGAAGFIGSHVVKNLVDRGFRNIVCFVRPSSDLTALDAIIRSRPQGARIELITGNLLSRADSEAACRNTVAIFHLAAGIGEKSFPDAFMNSVVATRNLLEATLTCSQLKRLVLVSSFSVYTNRQKRRLLDESSPLEQDHPEFRGEAYCYAKVRQEQIVADYGEKYGIPYAIVRPGSVYGPANAEFTGRVGIGTFGLFLHLGGSNTIPFTYVENCADAIVLSGLVKGIDREAFNVVDDNLPSSREFLRQYKANVNGFRSLYLPHSVSLALCYLWEKYSQWSHGQLPPAFNRKRWYADWKRTRYSNEKLKLKTGWRPQISTQEGLRRYFEACRQRNQHA